MAAEHAAQDLEDPAADESRRAARRPGRRRWRASTPSRSPRGRRAGRRDARGAGSSPASRRRRTRKVPLTQDDIVDLKRVGTRTIKELAKLEQERAITTVEAEQATQGIEELMAALEGRARRSQGADQAAQPDARAARRGAQAGGGGPQHQGQEADLRLQARAAGRPRRRARVRPHLVRRQRQAQGRRRLHPGRPGPRGDELQVLQHGRDARLSPADLGRHLRGHAQPATAARRLPDRGQRHGRGRQDRADLRADPRREPRQRDRPAAGRQRAGDLDAALRRPSARR